KEEKAFFSLPEFERWQATEDNVKSWKIKYYKGLGTSTSKAAKEYFSDMDHHRISFSYEGPQDDRAIELQSLMATIINLAQNFVGSNNINILQPIGQFGTRLHCGKDAASPRYIFTMLSSLARHLFPACDDVLLDHLYDDNQCIEPEWYCPIIPMVLVNGAEGIGTGYSTSVPNYNPREIVANIKRMLNGMEPEGMLQIKHFLHLFIFYCFRNLGIRIFVVLFAPVEPHKYMVFGQVGLLGSNSFEITELPTKTWTQTYKENVLEGLLYGNDKTSPFISDYKEYHTDVTVRFVVTLSPEKMEVQSSGIHISTGNMYKTHFVTEINERKLIIGMKSKNILISELESQGYDSDPVKAWKKSVEELRELKEKKWRKDNPEKTRLVQLLVLRTEAKKDEKIDREGSAAATKPSSFAEVLTPHVPEFCVLDIKKERATKFRKVEANDPGWTKLCIEDMTTQFRNGDSKKRACHFSRDSSEDDAEDNTDDINENPSKKGTERTTKKGLLLKYLLRPLLDLNEGANKRLSVERIYQKKTQLEHILLRPDSYVGSVEEASDLLWVYDDERNAIVQRQITYVPGLYKIFDEILGQQYKGLFTLAQFSKRFDDTAE
uniref:DNA topoisomerase (ATP-hydrolyzing) n=1 Tax=Amphimedon queenslandica TaxID=400682 RepID=A0A1X7UJI5_AMPQE